jgi:hypothetical protein
MKVSALLIFPAIYPLKASCVETLLGTANELHETIAKVSRPSGKDTSIAGHISWYGKRDKCSMSNPLTPP